MSVPGGGAPAPSPLSVGPALAAGGAWSIRASSACNLGQQCRDVVRTERGRSRVAELTYRETRALLPDDAHPAKPEPAGARL